MVLSVVYSLDKSFYLRENTFQLRKNTLQKLIYRIMCNSSYFYIKIRVQS